MHTIYKGIALNNIFSFRVALKMPSQLKMLFCSGVREKPKGTLVNSPFTLLYFVSFQVIAILRDSFKARHHYACSYKV